MDVDFEKDFKYQESRDKLSYHESLKLDTQKDFLIRMYTGHWSA